jgi:hypothetical protein
MADGAHLPWPLQDGPSHVARRRPVKAAEALRWRLLRRLEARGSPQARTIPAPLLYTPQCAWRPPCGGEPRLW